MAVTKKTKPHPFWPRDENRLKMMDIHCAFRDITRLFCPNQPAAKGVGAVP